jgi:hypothetical protein
MAFQAVAAIKYRQESSGVLNPEAVKTTLDLDLPTANPYILLFGIPPLIEHMLRMHYGTGVYPFYGLPRCPDRLLRRFIWPGIDDFCK